jgi:hypothetical protein
VLKKERHSRKITFSAFAENVILFGIRFGFLPKENKSDSAQTFFRPAGEEKVLRNDAIIF